MTQKKIVKWLTFRIVIELTDSHVPKGYPIDALAGVRNTCDEKGRYHIWFRELPTVEILVHECWHLFFVIMSEVDSCRHDTEYFNSEIYAYSFQHLFSQILDNLTGMKLYKKMYNREVGEDKKDE